jgi:hypothetical protein
MKNMFYIQYISGTETSVIFAEKIEAENADIDIQT